MAEYSGSACVAQWIWSGGTVALSGDFRTLNVNESGNPITATAGSDAHQVRLAGIGDANITMQLVSQDGASGTANAAAFRKNNVGTVIVGPYGTATNSLKYTLPAIINSSSIAIPYNDVAIYNLEFLNNTSGGLSVGAY